MDDDDKAAPTEWGFTLLALAGSIGMFSFAFWARDTGAYWMGLVFSLAALGWVYRSDWRA
jgi:hypothetical protein